MVIKISAPWLISNFWSKRHNPRNFPGSPVVKNPPGNAEDVGSVPGRGTKISYTGEQLKAHALCSLGATTRESLHHSERSHVTNKGAVCHNQDLVQPS